MRYFKVAAALAAAILTAGLARHLVRGSVAPLPVIWPGVMALVCATGIYVLVAAHYATYDR